MPPLVQSRILFLPFSILTLSVFSHGSRSLQPIRWPLTMRPSWQPFTILTLSVSSNGSRPLQRNVRRKLCPTPADFQYPQTDRGRCNAGPQAIDHEHRVTFSILKRIEAAATDHTPRHTSGPDDLSVSSNGSRPLQRNAPHFQWYVRRDFQYPQTDRGRCNITHRRFATTPPCLSVSSNGSRPLQLRTVHERDRRPHVLSVSSNGSRPLQLS